MGGALFVPGNIDDIKRHNHSKAEWNIYFDALAAKKIFASGIPITLIPLDLTNQTPLTQDIIKEFQKRKNPIAQLLADLLIHNQQQQPSGIWYFWDPLAAVIAAHANLASCKSYPVKIVLQPGENFGATLVDPSRGQKIEACLGVNILKFKHNLITFS